MFICLIFVLLIVSLASGFAALFQPGASGLAVAYVVGFFLSFISMLLSLIQLIRQRRAFLAGYPAVYAPVQDTQYAQPPSNPIYGSNPSAPPVVAAGPPSYPPGYQHQAGYQMPYFPPVMHGSMYQEDNSKEPNVPSQYPQANQSQLNPNRVMIGDFEYDKAN